MKTKNLITTILLMMLFTSISAQRYVNRFSKSSKSKATLLNKYRHGRPQANFWFTMGYQKETIPSILSDIDFNLSVSGGEGIVGAGFGWRVLWPRERSPETPVHSRLTFCFLYGIQIAKVPHNKNNLEKLRYLTVGIQVLDDFRGREIIVQFRAPLRGGFQAKLGIEKDHKTYMVGFYRNLFYD